MERAYKNQALKEGAAADAVTFNENSENCYLDPRCEVLWFRPTPFDSLTTSPLPTENLKRDFNGVMNGETNVGGSYLNRYSANRCILSSDAMNKDYWWNLAREIVWMGYSESLFLKAEAALRWPSLVDETAEALYLKGIKASMDYYEIDADKANEYISHLDGVKAFAGGSKEEQLEQIITQKWIAVSRMEMKDGQKCVVPTIRVICWLRLMETIPMEKWRPASLSNASTILTASPVTLINRAM